MFLRTPNDRDRFMHAEVVPRERQPFASSSLSSPLLILPPVASLSSLHWHTDMMSFKAANNK